MTKEESSWSGSVMTGPIVVVPQPHKDSSVARGTSLRSLKGPRHAASPDPRPPVSTHDARVRARLLIWSIVGIACLVLSQVLDGQRNSLFEAPSGVSGWAAIIAGLAGVWLAPGLALSAMLTRTGQGPAAWIATRIGTSLCWYVVVGPAIHEFGRGARVTTNGIIVATVATTFALCFGIAIGLARGPSNPRQRIAIAAISGGLGAQLAIWAAMRLWTHDINYDHIRRLDLLIVLACALLASVGVHGRPDLPAITRSSIRPFVVSAMVVVATAAVVVCIGAKWSPGQRMPSSFSITQIPVPSDVSTGDLQPVDVAFDVVALGPDGMELASRAHFVALDGGGRPIGAQAKMLSQNGANDGLTLLVTIDHQSRLAMCLPETGSGFEIDQPKITLRDLVSGVQVQAVPPTGWCEL